MHATTKYALGVTVTLRPLEWLAVLAVVDGLLALAAYGIFSAFD